MNPKTNERAVAAPPSDADWLEVVRRNVSGLRYGSVQIIVHEGRVTQIESLEKTRFPASREYPGSAIR
jgi:hypothetical protein